MSSSRKFASAEEVARLAGVSRSAVSRTFTDGASVSDETRQKVLAAAAELNYHVNHLARGLSQESSRPVCLVGNHLGSPFLSSLLEAVSRHIQALGRAVMLINTSGEAQAVESALHQALQYRASAVVVLSGAPAESLVQTCIQSGLRVVLVNRGQVFDGPVHITLGHEEAMQEAFDLFYRAGCRSFGLVTSTAGTPSLLAREQAFIRAIDEAGLAVTTVRAGPTRYATGQEAARQLLGRAKRPDAVLCTTDLLACGFLDTARHTFKLDVPRDVCVMGFDNIEQASWESYGLTTFHHPVEEIAASVAQQLADERVAGQTIQLPARPVWRNTIRPG
ncbi:LacI family DNA-binding transcriptional regulator [Vreelandella sp. EE27]